MNTKKQFSIRQFTRLTYVRSMKFRPSVTFLVVLGITLFVRLSPANPTVAGTDQLAANSIQIQHSFSGPDGAGPNAIIQANDGFFYGSTAVGGDMSILPDGAGTLFKIDGSGNYTQLHVFELTDGYIPNGLVQVPDGSFYGTTESGGQPSGGGAGVLFRMESSGAITILHAFVGGFACCDGAAPDKPPIQASDGKLYGVTRAGGEFRDIDHQGGFGTIYQFDSVTSNLTIIHSFNLPDGNGILPNGPLVEGTDGFLYGTTREGGGGVFKVDFAGNLTLLHSITESGEPLAGLIQGNDGFLYGTTDGPPGTAFRIDPAGTYSVINVFDGSDGFGLNQALLQASDGLFYGTAPQGGLLDFQSGDVFRLDSTGKLSVLQSFGPTNPTAGIIPNARLIQARDGSIFGANGIGGSGGHGTVFRFNPRAKLPIAGVKVQPPIVVAGRSARGSVKLSSPAPNGGQIVSLRATSFQVTIPATVTVPAGATTANFTIRTSTIGNNGDVRVYAAVNGQGIRTVFTIVP
jgi:uncharacterized repeat protein (TIGR03803 family)